MTDETKKSKGSKLHELLAVGPEIAKVAKKVTAEALTTFVKKPDHFKGQTRRVMFIDNTRNMENISESKQIVDTVENKLKYVFSKVGRSWDVLYQQDEANTRAKADLVIAGKTIAKDVPAQFLLSMENRLVEIRELISAVPTLDPTITWNKDSVEGEGVYKSNVTKTFKTEKVIRPVVLYEATKEHPAQVKEVSSDVSVAVIENVQRSGMISVTDKSEMLGRVDQAIRGVKKARQRANDVTVENIHVAKDLFNFILKGNE